MNPPTAHRFKKGYTPWNKGMKLSDETRAKMSRTRKGKRLSKEWREKISLSKRGERSHFWKGGISPEHERLRKTAQYKDWRKAVFERDGYTCQECGLRAGKGFGRRLILHADHIKPFALYPELRFDISNGRTLCFDCHKQTDTYGYNHVRLRSQSGAA